MQKYEKITKVKFGEIHMEAVASVSVLVKCETASACDINWIEFNICQVNKLAMKTFRCPKLSMKVISERYTVQTQGKARSGGFSVSLNDHTNEVKNCQHKN